MHYAFLLTWVICSFEMSLMALLGLILEKNIKNYQAVEYYKKTIFIIAILN